VDVAPRGYAARPPDHAAAGRLAGRWAPGRPLGAWPAAGRLAGRAGRLAGRWAADWWPATAGRLAGRWAADWWPATAVLLAISGRHGLLRAGFRTPARQERAGWRSPAAFRPPGERRARPPGLRRFGRLASGGLGRTATGGLGRSPAAFRPPGERRARPPGERHAHDRALNRCTASTPPRSRRWRRCCPPRRWWRGPARPGKARRRSRPPTMGCPRCAATRGPRR